MDEADGLTWEEGFSDEALGDRIAVTSDGGFRSQEHGSGCAFIVWWLVVSARQAEPIALSYAFWRHGRSAFEAEIVALDQALGFICKK